MKHVPWEDDGPALKLEFSRISDTRKGAMTLVIDTDYGQQCIVQYALSTRANPADVVADLRCREGKLKQTGSYSLACRRPAPLRRRTASNEAGMKRPTLAAPRSLLRLCRADREAVLGGSLDRLRPTHLSSLSAMDRAQFPVDGGLIEPGFGQQAHYLSRPCAA